MGRRNLYDEKANEARSNMLVWTIVGLVVMFGALSMATLVLKM